MAQKVILTDTQQAAHLIIEVCKNAHKAKLILDLLQNIVKEEDGILMKDFAIESDIEPNCLLSFSYVDLNTWEIIKDYRD